MLNILKVEDRAKGIYNPDWWYSTNPHWTKEQIKEIKELKR